MKPSAWVRRAAMLFLAWVTLRLVAKIALVLSIITSRQQTVVGPLLRDTVVLWFVISLLFGVWYWVIDGGGPDARRDGTARRYDFHFPQRGAGIEGWARSSIGWIVEARPVGLPVLGFHGQHAVWPERHRRAVAARQIPAHAASHPVAGGDRVHRLHRDRVGEVIPGTETRMLFGIGWGADLREACPPGLAHATDV